AHASAVQRFMTSAERGFHRSLKALRELQKARGFVPTILSAAPPEAATWGGLAEGNLPPIAKSASPSTPLPSANASSGFVPSKPGHTESFTGGWDQAQANGFAVTNS
ncbi:MAG: hypothetical protein JO061_20145, partial [Acidobacteriaceae bacterium]|nr:hypothetical protein [Acidobacteriaceae bacterium]